VHGVLHRRDGPALGRVIPEEEHNEGEHCAGRGREQQGQCGAPGAAVAAVGGWLAGSGFALWRRRGEQVGGVERQRVHPVGSCAERPAEERAVPGGGPESGKDGAPAEDGEQMERVGEERRGRGRVVVGGGDARGGELDVESVRVGGTGRRVAVVVVNPGMQVACGGGNGMACLRLEGGAAGEVEADVARGEDECEGRGRAGGGGCEEEGEGGRGVREGEGEVGGESEAEGGRGNGGPVLHPCVGDGHGDGTRGGIGGGAAGEGELRNGAGGGEEVEGEGRGRDGGGGAQRKREAEEEEGEKRRHLRCHRSSRYCCYFTMMEGNEAEMKNESDEKC
jgi:hypothetical protein